MRNPSDTPSRRQETDPDLEEIVKRCIRDAPRLRGVPLGPQYLDWVYDDIRLNWAELKMKHPVEAAITLAVVKRLNQLDELPKEWPQDSGNKRVTSEEDVSAVRAVIVDEIKEMMAWLPEPQSAFRSSFSRKLLSRISAVDQGKEEPRKPTKEALNELAKHMLQSGCPLRLVRAVLKAGSPRRRGRPVSKRGLAIEVLEARIANPRLTWNRLAERYCECSDSEKKEMDHAFKCREKIRKEVGHLKRFMAKYRIVQPGLGARQK